MSALELALYLGYLNELMGGHWYCMYPSWESVVN
jgi:hypothetical protein